MGCGACMDSTSHPQSHPYEQPHFVLSRLIRQYLLDSQPQQSPDASSGVPLTIHPVIPAAQCKELMSFMASTNGQLPDVQFPSMGNHNNQSAEFLAANALPEGEHLLNKIQRMVWKCFVILPQLGVTKFCSIPEFREQIADEDEIVEMSFHQIDLDVNRTFPTLKHLDRGSLTLLLRNIVNCMPGIGYTQGMNYYCGFLLLCGFSPKQSYYLMAYLFISPAFLLARNFDTSFKQVFLCNQILADSLPEKLTSHLRDIGLPQDIYTFSWFLCSFLYTLKVESCVILWDHMIKSGACGHSGGGSMAVLNFSILIMQRFQSDLHKLTDAQGVIKTMHADNLKKVLDETQVKNLVNQLKRRSKRPSGPNEKNERLVTKKEMMGYDKQLREIITSEEGYRKYVIQILQPKRTQGKTYNKDHQAVIHVGQTELIKVETHHQKPT